MEVKFYTIYIVILIFSVQQCMPLEIPISYCDRKDESHFTVAIYLEI